MTRTTQELIESLAREPLQVKPMPAPGRLMGRLGGVLLLYGILSVCMLGLRPDLALQFHRPAYAAEIALLALVAASALLASIYLAFPDQHQQPFALFPPLYGIGAFALLLAAQGFMSPDARMVIAPPRQDNGMDCTFCIAMIAVVPTALSLFFLRRGASVHPLLSGVYCVLAAASIGCLALRLSEPNDSPAHLVLYHYLPTLAFAACGAILGKFFLKW